MLARPERFELPTSGFVGRRSIQLNYGRVLLNQMLIAATPTGAAAARLFYPNGATFRGPVGVCKRTRLPILD